jgi:ABC-type multidrug transport system fused ATPase/permease subunit
MRRALCAAIMQAPMMFFMTENLGPLTGVFTRDLNVVCEERAYNLHLPCVCMIQRPTVRCFSVTDIFVAVADAIHMGTIYLMILLTTMGLIIAQIPYFAIACFILLAASVFIQIKYAKKVEAAKKEFQKSNDEVFHTLSDSLEGVKVLRTADQTIWSIDLLTEAFKNSRVSTVANEECTLWLARRADAMGVALSFLTCILCIVLEVAPGPKGLAISNSLQFLVFHSWMMKNVAAAIYSSGSVDRIYDYVSSIPQEVRTGDALDKLWPSKGDVEVISASSLLCLFLCRALLS